jgi:hypothetical protein
MSITGGAVETKDLDGTTIHFNSTVGTSPVNVPSSDGNAIDEVLVRCSNDQTKTNRLSVALDAGATYLVLSPGEFVAWSIKGSLKHISIKGNVAGVAYEIVMNRGLS